MKHLAPTAALIVIIVVIAFYDEMRTLLLYAGIGLLAFGAVVGVLAAVIGAGMGWEKWGTARAERIAREIENEAARNRARIIDTSDGTWFIQKWALDGSAEIAGLSHNPLWEINGHRQPATQAELVSWQAYNRRGANISGIQQLTSGVEAPAAVEPQKDLFALIDEHSHTDIWNTTGAGKTSLCRSIGFRRQAAGHQVVVLDSSEHPARWAGLERVASLPAQVETITRLFAIHERNGQALATGAAIEADFQQITVISEEWTDIIRALDQQGKDIARRFIDEMARKARKTGIHCVFTTQTNLAADLGLDGRYRVIRNFLQLEMTNHPDKGFICNAVIGGYKLGEFPVPPPPPMPPMLSQGYQAPSLESVEPEIIQPTKQEQEIMDLFEDGKSYNQIARKVYGNVGGEQNKRIKTVLSKYGLYDGA